MRAARAPDLPNSDPPRFVPDPPSMVQVQEEGAGAAREVEDSPERGRGGAAAVGEAEAAEDRRVEEGPPDC